MSSQRQMVTPNLKIFQKIFSGEKSRTRGIDPSGPASVQEKVRNISTARARFRNDFAHIRVCAGMCRQNSYPLGSAVVYGYGCPAF